MEGFASRTSTKLGTPYITYTYRPAAGFRTGSRDRDPATTTYPFSARYTYHANGTVSESEFYNAGSPATFKRYRYRF